MEQVLPRKPLSHAPTASFTATREQFKQVEDLKLVKHFALWLTRVSGLPITEENFEADLQNGIALCKVMSSINGSNLVTYHDKPSGIVALDVFKAKENLVAFQLASENLSLPVTFGTEDLEKKNIGRVISTLIFLAHVCHTQNVMTAEMDQEIVQKMEEMDVALEQSLGGSQLSWFQQLLIKLGLGDWISTFSQEGLKAYIATVKKNLDEKVESQKLLVKQQSLQIREALPEVLKSKIQV